MKPRIKVYYAKGNFQFTPTVVTSKDEIAKLYNMNRRREFNKKQIEHLENEMRKESPFIKELREKLEKELDDARKMPTFTAPEWMIPAMAAFMCFAIGCVIGVSL